MESSTYNIDQLAYPDGVTAAQVLEDLITVSVTVRVTDRSGQTATDTASATVNDYHLVINAGQDAAVLVNAQPAGTVAAPRRILVNGFHRLSAPLVPKTHTELTVNGTLDGGRVVTGWAPDGTGRWSVSGVLPPAYPEPNAKPETTTGPTANACKFRESLFINGTLLKRVTTLSAVSANTYYGDYTANKVYIGQDPVGKTVEMAKLPHLLKTTATGVTLRGNWVAQKAATPAQHGAVQFEGPDCLIEGGAVQWVHAIGVRLVNSHRTTIRGTLLQHCGQLGFANTSSNDTRWLSVRARSNNNEQFDWRDWESGGGKITRSDRVLVWDCRLDHNHGVGVWTDIDNVACRVLWNRIEDNDADGTRHEIGYSHEIGHNQIHRNGLRYHPSSGDPGPFATGAVNINSAGGWDTPTGRVWVHDNTCTGNRNGIFTQERNRTRDNPKYPDWPWRLNRVVVENNTISSELLVNPATGQRWVDVNGVPVCGFSGIGALGQTAARNTQIYTTDVVCRSNRYSPNEVVMRWTGTAWRGGTLAQAQAAGQETGSQTT